MKAAKATLWMVAKPTRYGHRGLPPLSLHIWEQCFAFEMGNEGVDIPAIDAFLASGPIAEDDPPALMPDGRKGWAPEGDTRRRLLSERQLAFEAYTRGDYGLAAALAHGLRRACEHAGFRHIAEPLAQLGHRRQKQVQAFSEKGARTRAIYSSAQREGWRSSAAAMPGALSLQRKAELIAQREGLPAKAIRTIRRELAKAGQPLGRPTA